MTSIAIAHAVHSKAEVLACRLAERTGMRILRDPNLIALAVRNHGLREQSATRLLEGHLPPFNSFTRERERNLALLRLTLMECLEREDVLLLGLSPFLLPPPPLPLVRVLFTADQSSRIHYARTHRNLSENAASRELEREDGRLLRWSLEVSKKSAWDKTLHDLVIPTDRIDEDQILELVLDGRKRVAPSASTRKRAFSDLVVAAKLTHRLVEVGPELTARVTNKKAEILLGRHVLRISRLKEKIRQVALAHPGIDTVEIKIGQGFHRANVAFDFEPDLPPRILLVDDEREFTHTLSDRLKLRNIETAVAHDGEKALRIAERGEADVMILDLKMPGVDGFEVLERVRKTHPEIAVVILTGHGSDADCKRCLEMGAFAYLRKPAEIGKLTETLNAAYASIRNRQVASA